MAYAFNPLTGKLDDVGAAQVNSDWNALSGVAQILNKPTIPAATTDASLLTSGTLSDSRLSANVSLDNINNNFSASQTFAGSANTAPNQTASSGSSLMTRDLVESSLISGGTRFYQIDLATNATTASSSGTQIRFGNSMADLNFWASPVAGTAALTITQSYLPLLATDNSSTPQSGWGYIDLSKPHTITATIFFATAAATDIIARIGLGPCTITNGALGVINSYSGYYFRIWRNNSTTWNGAVQCRTIQFNNSVITNATNTSPIVITVNGDHNLATGDQVEISNVGGNTAANNMWTVTVLSARSFSLNGSTGNGAFTSGGNVVKQSPAFQFDAGKVRKLFLVSNGIGTVSVYFGSVSGTPLATVSGMIAPPAIINSQVCPFNVGIKSVTDSTPYNGLGVGNAGFIF